MNDQDR